MTQPDDALLQCPPLPRGLFVEHYTSTACTHELYHRYDEIDDDLRKRLHERCREDCKFGHEKCLCPNHEDDPDRG